MRTKAPGCGTSTCGFRYRNSRFFRCLCMIKKSMIFLYSVVCSCILPAPPIPSVFSSMFRPPLAAFVVGVFLCTLSSPALALDEPVFSVGGPQTQKQDVIVILKPGADAGNVAAAHSASVHASFKAVNAFAGSIDSSLIQALENDPRVSVVEPDVTVTAFHHNLSPLQSLPTGINRVDADLSKKADIDRFDARVDGDIAVLDTGIDLDHPDLNVYRHVNFIDSSKSGDDDNGHGTHVAGIAAAMDNRAGVVGVAPGARLWAVKVLGADGSGKMSGIIAGIDYVAQHADEIEVANLSLGCSCMSQALTDAINRAIGKGVVFTVAAGNSAVDTATYSPASHSEVITVSAIADFDGRPGSLSEGTCRRVEDDSFASFSNFGAAVDIAAPGVCIRSTWKDGGYHTISGTSMAAPHVAGAVLLSLSGRPRPTNASEVRAVRDKLVSSGLMQSSGGGFTGDPDDHAEPLLSVRLW